MSDQHEGYAEEISETAIANGDALPVVADVHAIEPARPAPAAAVQAAAVGAAGLVAGAATFAVVKRASRRRAAGQPRRGRATRKQKAGPFGEVVASRSFLVDVHLLNRD